jgi:transposase
MSGREMTRVEVLSRVKAGTLSLGSAATLMAVSYRQAKRLARRYRAEGAKGLKHRSAGGVSNHARPTTERERVLALVREKYSGPIDVRFGPTLAAEHLASEDGVTVHHDTLRRWMLGCGVAPGNGRPIARGGSARHISASSCSSMAVSTCGTRPAPRAAA